MDLDEVLSLAVLAGASASLLAILCRVDALRYRRHRLSIVLMHGALGTASVLAGLHAVTGEVGPIDVAAVAASLCWVRASYRNWRDGVPQIYSTSPTPLDEDERSVPVTRPQG